jgi:hypothetical protein
VRAAPNSPSVLYQRDDNEEVCDLTAERFL